MKITKKQFHADPDYWADFAQTREPVVVQDDEGNDRFQLSGPATVAPGEVYTDHEKAILITKGEFFAQMEQCERFQTFFRTYFDLIKEVNEETKTVTFSIVELPPSAVKQRMLGMLESKLAEQQDKVVLATETDIKDL